MRGTFPAVRMGPGLVALLLALALPSGAAAETGHEGHDHGAEDHAEAEAEALGQESAPPDHSDEGLVVLTPEELAEFGIEVAIAGPGTIELFITVPGEVRPNADRLAHIVPRFSGIVTDVRVHLGDEVRKGQVLALVESDESLAPFEVKTLIPGTVIQKHIALGEAVSRERDTFVIADLSSVWVDLTVYQRDLSRIAKGQPARIFVGHDASPDSGRIDYITPIVDEATRTATARVVLPNRDGRWRPGMFVRGRVLVESAEAAVAVPGTALHTLEDRTVVFVQEDGGFVARPVTVGRRGDSVVEIRSGLAAGDRYVRRGGLTIKAELGREALDHAGHAH